MDLQQKRKNHLGKFIILALILGLITGQLIRTYIVDPQILKDIAENINLLTTIFLRLIKMIIAPLVFSLLVVGIARLTDVGSLGRMFLKTMLVFLVGSVISLAIGMVLVDYFEPGKHIGQALLAASQDSSKESHKVAELGNLNLKYFIEQLIPTSVINSFANNNVIQIVVFAIFFGIAGVSLGKPTQPVFDFFELVSKLMFKLTDYVMLFAPIAVFAAIASVVVKDGFGILSSYLIYFSEFVLSTLILWIVLIGLGFLILGKQVFSLICNIADSLGISFFTASSEAVLPNILEELDNMGIDRKISGFVLPLGYSFNLIASLLYCIFALMFIIQAHGQNLDLWQKIMVCLILLLTSKGIAGVPRASIVIIAATLPILGIPEAAIILLFPVDSFFDMVRSATNVFANALAGLIVNKWEFNNRY